MLYPQIDRGKCISDKHLVMYIHVCHGSASDI